MRLKVQAGFPYPMRVCAATWMPWMNVSFKDSIAYIAGPMANMLNILSEHLNFTFDVKPPYDGQWGIQYNSSGAWTGLVGMVQRNQCDMIMPLASTYGRSQIVYYTAYTAMTYSSIMAGKMYGGSVNVFAYFSIFSWQVWITILISIILLSFMLVLVDLVSHLPNYSWRQARSQFVRQLFEFLGTLLCESSPTDTTALAGRTIIASWWITVIVLMNTFSGQLKASMFLTDESGMINSIEDLEKDESLIPYTWKGSAYEAFVKEATNPSFQNVWKRIVRKGDTLLMEDLFSFEMLKEVQKRKKTIIMDIPSMKFYISSVCADLPNGEFYLAKKEFYAHTMGFAVRKDIDRLFLREMNKRIRWLVESKLVDRWTEAMFGNLDRCASPDSFSDQKMLGLNDFIPVFILWIFCLGLSTISLFIELGRYRLTKRKNIVSTEKSINYLTDID